MLCQNKAVLVKLLSMQHQHQTLDSSNSWGKQSRALNTAGLSTSIPVQEPRSKEPPIDITMTSLAFLFPALGGLLFGYAQTR